MVRAIPPQQHCQHDLAEPALAVIEHDQRVPVEIAHQAGELARGRLSHARAIWRINAG